MSSSLNKSTNEKCINDADSSHSVSSPGAGVVGSSTPSSNKSKIRGNMARRARSFKDDVLGKLSQIRTPTSTLGRAHSPHSPRTKNAKSFNETKPTYDLNYHVRQVQNALTHFKGIISKKRLEILPSNGTVVLESIINVYAALKTYTLNENSSSLISATTQVYLSLAKLLQLCDEVLLNEDGDECASLNDKNVIEVVDLVDGAVQNLVQLAKEKIAERESSSSYGSSTSASATMNSLQRPTVDVAGQRTSLPDIHLSPRERDILEQSSNNTIRASHSTESILRDSSPPPKPPLPNRISNPPPLPPKRRSQQKSENNDSIIDASLLTCVDRISFRSRSPDDNSSLHSASAGSLDSALNHSREEEELKALSNDQHSCMDDSHQTFREDIDRIFAQKSNIINPDIAGHDAVVNLNATNPNGKNQRSSNESGFVSMHSICASTQSVSAKSVQSMQSTKTCSSSSFASEFSMQQHHSQHNSFSASNKDDIMSALQSSSLLSQQHQQTNAKLESHCMTTASAMIAKPSDTFTLDNDVFLLGNSFGSKDLDEVPPALPVKKRSRSIKKERHISQYDNVEEIDSFSSSSVQISSSTSSSLKSSLFDGNGTELHIATTAGYTMQSKHQSLIEPRRLRNLNCDAGVGVLGELPPPIPAKKRHIMAYIEIFGNCNQNNAENQLRHSMHSYNISQSDHITHSRNIITHSQTMSLSPRHKQMLLQNQQSNSLSSPTTSHASDKPPALPPKMQRTKSQSISTTPPSSPKPQQVLNASLPLNNHHQQSLTSHNNFSHDFANAAGNGVSGNSGIGTLPQQHIIISGGSGGGGGGGGCDGVRDESGVHNRDGRNRTHNNDHGVITSGNDDEDDQNTQYNNFAFDKENDADYYVHLCHTYEGETPSNNNNNSNLSHNNFINNHGNNANISETSATINSVTGGAIAPSSANSTSPCNNTKEGGDDNDIDDEERDECEVVLRRSAPKKKLDMNSLSSKSSMSTPNLMEEIDVKDYLVLKNKNEDGPDVKGGYLDALIVHASKVQKIYDNAFGEAFITTFRTFIRPMELIEKLNHRYTMFCCQVASEKIKAAKESFALLVRVVVDLTTPDLTLQLLRFLNDFVYNLVCAGELNMARPLREIIVEKCKSYKLHKSPVAAVLPSLITNPPSLLELKSSEIAEQMTLLDAELFQRIEIPEVLIWAQEQNEEKSPNLTKFTEHFNKMSYWARSQILRHEDAKDREKLVIKFIKIMKHLRKINNYNSYLALLSALDSAPIRRLEWHKTITEGLKDYCALIESNGGFRAYRRALAETNPPCIPYIGLVLQDLTFVHVGNPDYLNDGVINFSKRWQQHNIVVNMKRFRKDSSYPFKKNERIIGLFDGFQNHLDEDAMWQISENIKPRPSRRPLT